jgi:transcriptional regulator of acetoin/glycerol metabolism
MKPKEKGGDTEPEEHASREAQKKRAVLLISSLEGRLEALLPAEGTLTVGRGRSTAGSLESGAGDSSALFDDRLLSRGHLRIARTERGYEVTDLGSTNGTFLDGPRLDSPARLTEGAIVLFGNQVGIFRLVSGAELAALRQDAAVPFGLVPTFSPVLALTYARLRKLARTDSELLLVGEMGVGKEVCARAIHRASGRRGPFVAINCASLPAAQVESELFGYLAGAHSTAKTGKPGLVEAAEGGTLLLDEIGEMAPELQGKIFRFLQDRTITPLGATRARRVDVRVLAATTRMATGTGPDAMRADLVARLGADPIPIPPLRRRPEEVPSLLRHFGAGMIAEVEPAALRALSLHGWPLNVRELEKTVANAMAMSTGGHLRLEHLPSAIRGALERGAPIEYPRRQPRSAPERAELEHLLKQHGGNVASVARTLDRKWNVVWRWIVKYRLRAKTVGDGKDKGKGEGE